MKLDKDHEKEDLILDKFNILLKILYLIVCSLQVFDKKNI